MGKYRKAAKFTAFCCALVLALSLNVVYFNQQLFVPRYATAENGKFIKWVDFNVPYKALEKAYFADIKSYGTKTHVEWTQALALLATKYGGNFKKYKAKDLDSIITGLKNGESYEKLKNSKYYGYFLEVMQTVLARFLGEYEIETFTADNQNDKKVTKKYGLIAFSPIAEGFSFSHYDDFGAGRTYGYKRRHLGHDVMGRIGTPIIAIEGGIVEELGWNRYGGWRIGIRSFDTKRYYYYAHLRKDSPYHAKIQKGVTVNAGDVIGYLGMTGYSTKQNTNNINTPHLHFGLQLIFDESQKEGASEIWIDVYNIFLLLQKNKSTVEYDRGSKEYNKKFKTTVL